MLIIVNLIMSKRKISFQDLVDKIDLNKANLSILKTNKGKAIRFSTLDKKCKILDCPPNDILEYQNDDLESREKYK